MIQTTEIDAGLLTVTYGTEIILRKHVGSVVDAKHPGLWCKPAIITMATEVRLLQKRFWSVVIAIYWPAFTATAAADTTHLKLDELVDAETWVRGSKPRADASGFCPARSTPRV